MISQLDLDHYSATPQPDPATGPTVSWLESYLLHCSGWVRSARICTFLGIATTEDTRRLIRALASASDRIISGDQGYAHADTVSAAEIEHFIARNRSQINTTGRRILRVRNYLHTQHPSRHLPPPAAAPQGQQASGEPPTC